MATSTVKRMLACWFIAALRVSSGWKYHSISSESNALCSALFAHRATALGHFRHIAGVYLGRYATESAWRDDHRAKPNGMQFRAIIGLVAKNKPSGAFCGHWQRSATA